jgi:RecA-family ATPase
MEKRNLPESFNKPPPKKTIKQLAEERALVKASRERELSERDRIAQRQEQILQRSREKFNRLQKINHFPDSWCVGRKDRLYRTFE